MKVRLVLAITLVLFCTQSLWALTGREIMEKSDALKKPDSAVNYAVMTIRKGKRTLEKEFEMIVKTYPDGEDKTLISFVKPTRIKLLVHAHKDADDDQWLRLSSGKVKRIAGSDKNKSFVNSHLTYEDMEQMGSFKIDDFTFKKLDDQNRNGMDCYCVEAIAKDKKNKKYEKNILFVRKSDFVPIRIELYKNNTMDKIIEQHDIKEIDGIITAQKVVISMADGKGDTTLELKTIKYNQDIPDVTFNKEAFR